MRTPIGSSLFFLAQILTLLTSVSVDPKVRRYINLVISQLTFVQSFVEDLLDLRTMRDGVFSLVQEPFNPSEVIELVFSVFKPQADAKNIKLDFQLVQNLPQLSQESTAVMNQQHRSDDIAATSDCLPTNRGNSILVDDVGKISELPKILGDERRFKQVLINLVKNALKFTLSGSITIKACYESVTQSLVVHVVDTGTGIALEDQGKLFSKFGKLHRTADLNHEGIGLGLTIVKQIVEKSGGSVNVYSEGIGKGSTFYFNMKATSIGDIQAPPRLLVVHESVDALEVEFTSTGKNRQDLNNHKSGHALYELDG